MHQNTPVRHAMDDLRSQPDMKDPVLIRQQNIKRAVEWVAKQPPEVQQYFCKHGSYVGYQATLSFKCPECNSV